MTNVMVPELTEREMENEHFINIYKDISGIKPRNHPFFDASDEERERVF